MRVRRFAHTGAVIVLLSLVASACVLANPAYAATPSPRTPAGLPSAIEPMTDYVGQTSCDTHSRPGTVALAKYLAATYRTTTPTTWASVYQCGTDGSQSEHYEGRAIDWMVNVHNAKQRAAANATIAWLLATDNHGNRFAMARRLGVMYVIYNNRMWGSWDGQWQNYNGCASLKSRSYDNACHRTHMHISLSWNGAMGRTSFWTKRVYPEDFGPCRAADLNWAPRYAHPRLYPCPNVAVAHAAKGASTIKRALVHWSGARVYPGSSGPVVTAVQRALHVSASGHYTAATISAVRAFQTRHACPITGAMNQTTWRALLRSVR